MRYGIFSDIHSNLEALEAVLACFEREAVDQYLCVGDLVGYATNPNECIALAKERRWVTVAGNHDWASVGLYASAHFNLYAMHALEWTRACLSNESSIFLESLKLAFTNQDLTLVHGTLDMPEEFDYMLDSAAAYRSFRLLTTQACFVGHTHVPGYYVMDTQGAIHYGEDATFPLEPGNKYIVNVGSVGQPRDGNPAAAYCIFDTGKNEIAIKRSPYPWDVTRGKIIEAGLSPYLGDRLLTGH